jgi:excinuclease ABC subunit A
VPDSLTDTSAKPLPGKRLANRGSLEIGTGGHIRIRGARQHNLKNVDLDIPKGTLTVITGLSGSGKSSLAFDTIYAEGQRRYVESLSAYARQFLELQQKPDVDSIEGLSPAISIEQKTTSHNPRSTVGTVTEIADYMRLLWARVGVPYSPATGLPIEAQTVSQMVDRVMALPEGSRLLILAPIARGKKGEWKKEIAELQRRGFERVKVNGTLYRIEEVPALDKKKKHDIEAVVDRVVVREGAAQRLADSFETALGLSDGVVYLEGADNGERTVFSSRFACPVSGFTIEEISPGSSPSTRPRAPALNATGSAPKPSSTPLSWCRMTRSPSAMAPLPPGPAPPPPITTRPSRAWPATTRSRSRPPGQICPNPSERPSSTAPGRS